MAKKLVILIFVLLLVFTGSDTIYASDPLDELDDRYEAETIAGITWDQINEMADNSPNSLTPIQGLVLWMFAILAFLKLAQKMDNLLQSLGLNVTQTGGRALGDLMVAGMAIRNIGSTMSKGMGMFGLSKDGGASGDLGASGTSVANVGSFGQPSIPSNGLAPTGNPNNSSLNNATPNASNEATTANRNIIGKSTAWFKQDGFAQGAVKAGAKGGLIGVGAYSAKAGASSIGNAISHFSDKAPVGGGATIENGTRKAGQHLESLHNINLGSNPEEYQATNPPGGFDGNNNTLSHTNTDDYHEAAPYEDSDNESSILSSTNEEAFSNFDTHDVPSESKPIATSVNNNQSHIADTSDYSPINDAQRTTNVGDGKSSLEPVNNLTWQNENSQVDSNSKALTQPPVSFPIASALHSVDENLVVSKAALPQEASAIPAPDGLVQSNIPLSVPVSPQSTPTSATPASITSHESYNVNEATRVSMTNLPSSDRNLGSENQTTHPNNEAGTHISVSTRLTESALPPSAQVVYTEKQTHEIQPSTATQSKATSNFDKKEATRKASVKAEKRI